MRYAVVIEKAIQITPPTFQTCRGASRLAPRLRPSKRKSAKPFVSISMA
jgi:hypothetical protein